LAGKKLIEQKSFFAYQKRLVHFCKSYTRFGWLAGWLTGWKSNSFEELGRDSDFGLFAIDSVGYRGGPTIKFLDPATLWVQEL
jgi:hypothetical protein